MNLHFRCRRCDVLLPAGLALFLGGVTGCQTPMTSPRMPMDLAFWSSVSISRGDPFLIVSSPAQGGGYKSATWGKVSHPYLFPLGGDRYILTYGYIGDTTAGNVGIAAADWPAYTLDAGKTWQFGDPIVWADGHPNHTTSAHKGDSVVSHLHYGWSNLQLTNGVMLAYHRDCAIAGATEYGNYRATQGIWSRDGEVWHGPFTARYYVPFKLGDLYLNPRSAVELDDGSILTYGFGRAREQQRGRLWHSSMVFRSADGGQNFDFLSFVGTPDYCPWGDEGATEGAMTRLPDGRIVTVTRTGAFGGSGASANMLFAVSEDDGKTWERRRMKHSGVMPKLLLMSNGVLVCAAGRPDSYVMFSVNGGYSWGKKITLNPSSVKTSGYVDIAEVSPGRLLVVYDLLDYPMKQSLLTGDSDRVNGVFGLFMDVTRRR